MVVTGIGQQPLCPTNQQHYHLTGKDPVQPNLLVCRLGSEELGQVGTSSCHLSIHQAQHWQHIMPQQLPQPGAMQQHFLPCMLALLWPVSKRPPTQLHMAEHLHQIPKQHFLTCMSALL